MPADVTIPSMGVAMESAILLTWLKQEGDSVEANQPIAEIETDKSTVELLAPISGRLGPHLYEEGDEIPVGETVAAVLAKGEALEEAPPAAPQVDPEPASAERSAAPDDEDRPGGGRKPRRNSPRARRLAAEAEEAATSQGVEKSPPGGRFRDLIAKRVSESWREIPHFTVVREVQVDALEAALAQLRTTNSSVTLTDLLLRAQALAVADVDDPDDHGDLGLAVAGDHGVMIPVVRNVVGRTLAELVSERRAAVDRGRAGRLSQDDADLPASTLSNLGPFGVDSFTGIVAARQTTLFTVGATRRVAVVRDEQVVPASTLVVTVNADHRALDGADVAKALKRFAETVERPEQIATDGALR